MRRCGRHGAELWAWRGAVLECCWEAVQGEGCGREWMAVVVLLVDGRWSSSGGL